MPALKLLWSHTINCMVAANMKEAQLKRKHPAVVMKQVVIIVMPIIQLKLIVAKMVNVLCPVMMEKIVVQRWIAAKMVNAPKKAIAGKNAAKNRNNTF